MFTVIFLLGSHTVEKGLQAYQHGNEININYHNAYATQVQIINDFRSTSENSFVELDVLWSKMKLHREYFQVE